MSAIIRYFADHRRGSNSLIKADILFHFLFFLNDIKRRITSSLAFLFLFVWAFNLIEDTSTKYGDLSLTHFLCSYEDEKVVIL